MELYYCEIGKYNENRDESQTMPAEAHQFNGLKEHDVVSNNGLLVHYILTTRNLLLLIPKLLVRTEDLPPL